MGRPEMGAHNACTHVNADLATPTFNGLTSALYFLDIGRTEGAEISLDGAERWARASLITLQTAEDAAGGPPEQTGFVVTAQELQALHQLVKEAHDLIVSGRVYACVEVTAKAWRRAKVAKECLEAADLIKAGRESHAIH